MIEFCGKNPEFGKKNPENQRENDPKCLGIELKLNKVAEILKKKTTNSEIRKIPEESHPW